MKGEDSYILQAKSISKSFPGVKALDKVSFTLARGEIHALVGENGAGKSTFVKILTGAIQKDEGEIIFRGQSLKSLDSHRALSLGVSVVHQDFALLPYLNVTENIFLGRLPQNSFGVVDWKKADEEAKAILEQLRVQIPLHLSISHLSPGQQQMTAIARALSQKSEVLILDEPTARLSQNEVKRLFEILRLLKQKGMGIIYISHILEEVLKISDRITVLKDGKKQGTVKTSETNMDEIIRMMIGYAPQDLSKKRRMNTRNEEILSVRKLEREGIFEDISFALHKGEVLGLTGLVGAKKTEVIRCIVGLDQADSGQIFVEGKEVKVNSPSEAVKLGIGFIPENRLSDGIVPKLSVRENISLSNLRGISFIGILKLKYEASRVLYYAKKLQIKMSSLNQRAENLSGGNQQKVILARWLNSKVKCLIFDQPTCGIDVGARRHIHQIIRNLAMQGLGVIVVSEDIPEVIDICDRILLMRKGKLVGHLWADETNQEQILKVIAA